MGWGEMCSKHAPSWPGLSAPLHYPPADSLLFWPPRRTSLTCLAVLRVSSYGLTLLRSIHVKLLQLWAHATNELHQLFTPQWGHPVAVESCTVWRIASTVHGQITAGTWNCVTSSQVHLAACCGRCRTVRGVAGRQVEVQRLLATCWTTLSRKDSFDALSWPPATSPW